MCECVVMRVRVCFHQHQLEISLSPFKWEVSSRAQHGDCCWKRTASGQEGAGSERQISFSKTFTRSIVFISPHAASSTQGNPAQREKYSGRGRGGSFHPLFSPPHPLCRRRAQGSAALVSGGFGYHWLSGLWRLCAGARALTGKLLNF